MRNQEITGYPSIDKPWLKYYSDETLHMELPMMNCYSYMKQCNSESFDKVALDYEYVSITYGELFTRIDEVANSLIAIGINEGDTITSCLPNIPEAVYLIYAAAKIGARIDLIDPLTNQSLLAKYCNNAESKAFFTLDIMGESAISNLSICTYDYVILVSPVESLPVPNTTSDGITFNESVISWATYLDKGKNNVPFSHSNIYNIRYENGTLFLLVFKREN